jgi:ATP synthase F1 delta subunit
MLDELFPNIGIQTETARELISSLITTSSAHQLKRILDDFDSLRAFDEGKVKAVVTSAQPLSEEQVRRLTSVLQKQLAEGDELELEQHVDEALLGGLKVEMNDQQVDLSVSQRLGELDAALRSQ